MQRYSEYEKLLESICKDKFLPLSTKKVNDGFNFYYVTLNGNREYDKTVVFSAGIHGDELAGPYAIVKFLIDYKEIDPSIRIVLFPVVNPHGFDNNIRTNSFRQDINRRFCDKLLSNEAKCIYDVLKTVKPDLFVSLHEWSGDDAFYMYASDVIKKDIISGMPQVAKDCGFKLFNKRKVNGEEAIDGIIWHPQEGYKEERSACTLENKMYTDGIHYICTETPRKAKLTQRVKCQVGLMNFVIEKLCK